MKSTYLRHLKAYILLSLCPLFSTAGCASSPENATKQNSEITESAEENAIEQVASETIPLSSATVTEESQKLCPSDKAAPDPLPGITAKHRELSYWLERSKTYGDIDEVLLSPNEIRQQNGAYRNSFNDLNHRLTHEEMVDMIDKRVVSIGKKFNEGNLTFEDLSSTPDGFWEETQTKLHQMAARPELRVLLEPTMIHCGPHMNAYITKGGEARFSRNHCSMAKAQEPIEILFEYPEGLYFARTRYSWGWIDKNAATVPISETDKPRVLSQNARYFATNELELNGQSYPRGSFFAGTDDRLLLFGKDGVSELDIPDGVVSTQRALTRRAFLETLFLFLDEPYGWGGNECHRDCSRLLLDVMQSFGLELPRHSGDQAQAASFHIDISGVQNIQEKVNILEEANRRGIVFLNFPGHIMAYLGTDDAGEPTIFHAFSEYLEHCTQDEPPVDTLVHVDKVTISHLDLGEQTRRTSFAERATRIALFGRSPGEALQGMSTPRPSQPPDGTHDKCTQKGFHVWSGPRQPVVNEPVNIVISTTSNDNIQTARLAIRDPEGGLHPIESKLTLGPPSYIIASWTPDKAGRWEILFGDSSRCDASSSIKVGNSAQASSKDAPAPAGWTNAHERLFSIFVARLFDYPPEQELTWTNLHTILKDPEHNILYNYLGKNEDEGLKLEPDCADLPFMLRAYFAWKLNLAMGYRKCSRGKAGSPPKCDSAQFSENMIDVANPTKSFHQFVNGSVRNAIHSGSGRTAPENNETDVYPIPLEKRWLRPGTSYADPYGHVLVISGYVPQTATESGILFAVDAQPDGTIARKRFWKGNFLFTPDTTDVGAGFKAFRPISVSNGSPQELSNEQLGKDSPFVPYSHQQYDLTTEQFYDAMEAIINPRALDPSLAMKTLVDSLHESAQKRVTSVDNGEQYMKTHSIESMVMPKGYPVFETTGPWEDFATPSRDMRLLIAIDTVLDYPGSVRRNAERYKLLPNEVDSYIENLNKDLEKLLKERTITYIKSDGSPQTLTLQDIVDRRAYFEIAYHPADCIELRWGAQDHPDELATCNRHAPTAEKQRVLNFRKWFIERRRPPR